MPSLMIEITTLLIEITGYVLHAIARVYSVELSLLVVHKISFVINVMILFLNSLKMLVLVMILFTCVILKWLHFNSSCVVEKSNSTCILVFYSLLARSSVITH